MNQSTHQLWYDRPATDWHQALPIGNGHMGAMVFGDPCLERIQLNEESIWAGPPVPEIPNGAGAAIAEARSLLAEGRHTEADDLILNEALSPRISPRSQQPLGDITIQFHGRDSEEIDDYRRQLDMHTAAATASFRIGDVEHLSEVFCSVEENLCVARYRSATPGLLDCTIQLKREIGAISRCMDSDSICISGQASHRGEHLGVKFAGVLRAVVAGGVCRENVDSLEIVGADEFVLYFGAATDYHFADPLDPLPHDLLEIARARVDAAIGKGFSFIRERHLSDHQALYSRVCLNLGGDHPSEKSIDTRVQAVRNGETDIALEALQFHYGRYLLISSSRPGCMPANLQGVWNECMAAPWNADYHTNINLQMNYWPAEVANLGECHMPLFDLIENLLPSARRSAAKLGCRGAFMGHTTDAWQFTSFFGLPGYGMWVMGLAWCSRHFMEHVRYTGDMVFLKQRALPVLRECALFFLDWLVRDPETGLLVSGPSTSPENRFISGESTACLTMGCAMDQQIIWDTFTNYLEAASLAEESGDIRNDVVSALTDLAPTTIGKDGRLMEWADEFEEADPGHRHVSHLFAIHPGCQFDEKHTPEMVIAARKSLDYRLSHGGGHTGWSRTWLINFRARMHEAEKAHKDILAFIATLTVDNLFCTHPPFQIDGNFGYTAGVAEMLLQSHTDEIVLLPALPQAWSKGSVTGLCARGGFEIAMSWDEGALTTASVLSRLGNRCNIRYGDTTMARGSTPGERFEVRF